MRKTKNKNKVILIIIAMVVVVSIGRAVKDSTEGILFDVAIMDYIHSKVTAEGVSIMKNITLFGSKYYFGTVGLAMFIFLVNDRSRRNAWLVILSIVGSYILNAVIKTIFSRTRPLDYLLIEQGGYSFPSGHSMVSMSFYTTITYILLENVKNKTLRRFIWIGNFVLIGIIGFSRLYLGVHWPTDVIVGYLVGYIFFVISKTIVKE